MSTWIRCANEMPPTGVVVEVRFNGHIIKAAWGGSVWDLDPSGQIELMWWRWLE